MRAVSNLVLTHVLKPDSFLSRFRWVLVRGFKGCGMKFEEPKAKSRSFPSFPVCCTFLNDEIPHTRPHRFRCQ
jgi:hypothetical protein